MLCSGRESGADKKMNERSGLSNIIRKCGGFHAPTRLIEAKCNPLTKSHLGNFEYSEHEPRSSAGI